MPSTPSPERLERSSIPPTPSDDDEIDDETDGIKEEMNKRDFIIVDDHGKLLF